MNIQENGLIQVALKTVQEGHEETAEKLARNDAQIIRKVVVKPTVPAEGL